MNILALIPARGGSKGVPRKNIKNLGNKPLIAWTIEAAKKSRYPLRVVVTTDDPEIAAVAKAYGAEVPFMRPKELAQDLSTDIEFINHALDWFKENEDYEPDIILRLPPTSPLRQTRHIDEAIDKLIANPDIDAVRAITEAEKHPYKYWKISESDNRLIEPFLSKEVTTFDQPHVLPRQLFPDAYMQTGAVDATWTRAIKETGSPIGRKIAYTFMEPEYSVNIDHRQDFDKAEFFVSMFNIKDSGGDDIFENLFTFEMANNHQGDINHGERIIDEMARVAQAQNIKAAVKFQFRNLSTFIHPDHLESKENKHIPRFRSTEISKEGFKHFINRVKEKGLISMATPFDEPSADMLTELDVEIVKVASCSAKDWPLLEKIATLNKPVIVSTGGLDISDIDNLVSFFEHRYVKFAIMHCVSIYPTPYEKLHLEKIATLKKRYPNITIGFSTHEEPDNYEAVQIAYAKGARIFERHVGIPTETITLNKYSSTPEQVEKWVEAYKRAVLACGPEGEPMKDEQEAKDLKSLMRGVYLRRDIRAGETISEEDVFFAMPIADGQMNSGEFKAGIVADRDYSNKESIPEYLKPNPALKNVIYQTIHEVKGMLNEARIPINYEYGVELSHHYGLDQFKQVGIVIIDCINREYCKKIIVQLPGQVHPYHHHLKKEETFHVLSGVLEIEIEGKRKTLSAGDMQVVPRGARHKFWTNTGVVFEEISTTHFNDDSIYEDPIISSKKREQRKTKLVNWGRYQFD